MRSVRPYAPSISVPRTAYSGYRFTASYHPQVRPQPFFLFPAFADPAFGRESDGLVFPRFALFSSLLCGVLSSPPALRNSSRAAANSTSIIHLSPCVARFAARRRGMDLSGAFDFFPDASGVAPLSSPGVGDFRFPFVWRRIVPLRMRSPLLLGFDSIAEHQPLLLTAVSRSRRGYGGHLLQPLLGMPPSLQGNPRPGLHRSGRRLDARPSSFTTANTVPVWGGHEGLEWVAHSRSSR